FFARGRRIEQRAVFCHHAREQIEARQDTLQIVELPAGDEQEPASRFDDALEGGDRLLSHATVMTNPAVVLATKREIADQDFLGRGSDGLCSNPRAVSKFNDAGNPVLNYVFRNADGTTRTIPSADPGRVLITGDAGDAQSVNAFKIASLW